MRLKILTFVIFLVLALTALSQGVDNSTPANNNSGDWPPIATFALLAVIILALFAGIPLLYNTIEAHKHLTEMQKSLDVFIREHADKIDKDSLIQIIHECVNADPAGAPGTTRGVMALTITLVVGTSLFFIAAYKVSGTASDSIKEVLLTLTGALTAIIGFYFGGKSGEPKPIEPKAAETKETGPTAEAHETEEQKAKLYLVKADNVSYQEKQYPKGTTADLANVPTNIRDGWLLDKKIEPYVGEQKDVRKELEGKPGWYKIIADFHYQDDPYIKDNVMNLTDVPASILAEWIKNKWVEPYKGPVA
jgi:uncharacterized membrane protein